MNRKKIIISNRRIAIAKRWLGKAGKYTDESNVEQMMDRFFSLYVAYNAIYEKDKKDRNRAVNFISKYLTDNKLTCIIDSSKEYQQIIEKIKDNTFHIYGEASSKNHEKDSVIISQIENGGNTNQSVLNLIYGIRCNMFHGEKQIIAEQLDLLIPANKILEKLVNELIVHIENI